MSWEYRLFQICSRSAGLPPRIEQHEEQPSRRRQGKQRAHGARRVTGPSFEPWLDGRAAAAAMLLPAGQGAARTGRKREQASQAHLGGWA